MFRAIRWNASPSWDPLTWSCPASAEPTYPGVYIEESPGGGRTIGGVSTCAAASIGFTLKGPIDEAVHLSSFADFERHFADVPPKSAIAQALEHYFLHGGTKAWIVRSASGTPSGSLSLLLYQPIDQSG